MFKVHLGDTPHSLAERDFQDLGAATDGFSGSDVAVVVKDVLMQPIRLLREATHFRKVGGGPGVWGPVGGGGGGGWMRGASANVGQGPPAPRSQTERWTAAGARPQPK
jgi:SpoVK/Ycf46/Vps4 family AAA+-type ATPase